MNAERQQMRDEEQELKDFRNRVEKLQEENVDKVCIISHWTDGRCETQNLSACICHSLLLLLTSASKIVMCKHVKIKRILTFLETAGGDKNHSQIHWCSIDSEKYTKVATGTGH